MMPNLQSPTVLLLAACLICVVFCQNGNKQQEYLRLLGKHANGVFVNTSSCITLAATILRCELNSSSLIIDPAGTTVALDGVDIRLCLCDSSVSVVYYLTNETNITVDCTQCPFRLTEGGLELDHSIMVFKKERDGRNETNVGIVVLVDNDRDTPMTMFNGTIPLTQQEDTCGNSSKGPPDPGTCGTTTSQPPMEPTTTASTSTTSGPAVNRGIHHAAIIVLVLLVVIAAIMIILSICLVIVYQKWKEKKRSKDQPSNENSLLTSSKSKLQT